MSEIKKAICKVSVSALTKSNYTNSILVSQILFGEICYVNTIQGKYLFIETEDKLIGWVLKDHFLINKTNITDKNNGSAYTIESLSQLVAEEYHLNIPFGSTLRNFDGLSCQFMNERFTYNGLALLPNKDNITPKVLARISRQLLKAPFLKGGMTVFGLDNINLIYLIYKVCGYNLSRNVTNLIKKGDTIDFVEQVQIGDIAYFENKKGNISHAGIIIGASQILHLHDIVKIDYLDHHGIYSIEKKKYTHRLRLVKRIFPTFHEDSIELLMDKKEITNQINLFG